MKSAGMLVIKNRKKKDFSFFRIRSVSNVRIGEVCMLLCDVLDSLTRLPHFMYAVRFSRPL